MNTVYKNPKVWVYNADHETVTRVDEYDRATVSESGVLKLWKVDSPKVKAIHSPDSWKDMIGERVEVSRASD
jgi:hypothetical protein